MMTAIDSVGQRHAQGKRQVTLPCQEYQRSEREDHRLVRPRIRTRFVVLPVARPQRPRGRARWLAKRAAAANDCGLSKSTG